MCHFVWDASIAINGYSHATAVVFNVVFFVGALVCTLLWSRDRTPPVPAPLGPLLDGRITRVAERTPALWSADVQIGDVTIEGVSDGSLAAPPTLLFNKTDQDWLQAIP